MSSTYFLNSLKFKQQQKTNQDFLADQ